MTVVEEVVQAAWKLRWKGGYMQMSVDFLQLWFEGMK